MTSCNNRAKFIGKNLSIATIRKEEMSNNHDYLACIWEQAQSHYSTVFADGGIVPLWKTSNVASDLDFRKQHTNPTTQTQTTDRSFTFTTVPIQDGLFQSLWRLPQCPDHGPKTIATPTICPATTAPQRPFSPRTNRDHAQQRWLWRFFWFTSLQQKQPIL